MKPTGPYPQDQSAIRQAFLFALAMMMGGIAAQWQTTDGISFWRPFMLAAAAGLCLYLGVRSLSAMKADPLNMTGFWGSVSRTVLWVAMFAAFYGFVLGKSLVPWSIAASFITYLALDYFFGRHRREPPSPP